MFTKSETNKVKGIAILFLVFHHMYRTVDDIAARGVTLHMLTDSNLSKLAYCLRICVYIFAIISAYGISLQYETIKDKKHDTFKFIIKRWIKLLAPFWFTLVCIWLVYAIVPGLDPFQTYQGGNIVGMMAGEFFAILDVLGYSYNMIVGVAWYMNFAVLELLAIPFLYYLCEKFGWAILLFTSAFYNFIPVVFNSDFGGDYNYYIFAVEVGILLSRGDVMRRIKEKYDGLTTICKVMVVMILILIMFGTPYMAWFKVESNIFGARSILFTTGAIACIFTSYLGIREKHVEKILAFLGRYSGDMFLTHTLVYRHLANIVFLSNNLFVQYVTCVIICLGVALLLGVLKKYTRYNQMINKLCEKISGC